MKSSGIVDCSKVSFLIITNGKKSMNTGVVGGVIPCPLEILIAMAWATIVELEVETTLNRFMCRLDLPLGN